MVVVGKGVEGRLATLTPPLSTVRPLLPKPEHYSPIFHPKTLDITQNVQVMEYFVHLTSTHFSADGEKNYTG